jgi:aryl-alcohol dehydrogenase-like predicted oxidoreductase
MGRVLPLPQIAALAPRFGVFDIPALRKSLETSLRALRMERLDALLLHEVDEHDLSDGTVMAWLEDLRMAGKIGSYGIASTGAQTQRLVVRYRERLPIVQTASTVLENGLATLGKRGHFFTITHSVLAGALQEIWQGLIADAAFRAQ